YEESLSTAGHRELATVTAAESDAHDLARLVTHRERPGATTTAFRAGRRQVLRGCPADPQLHQGIDREPEGAGQPLQPARVNRRPVFLRQPAEVSGRGRRPDGYDPAPGK